MRPPEILDRIGKIGEPPRRMLKILKAPNGYEIWEVAARRRLSGPWKSHDAAVRRARIFLADKKTDVWDDETSRWVD